MLLKSWPGIVFCIGVQVLHAQQKLYIKNNAHGVQYGFSVKAQVELSTVQNTQPPHFRLAIAGGIGTSFIDNNIYPTLNGEMQVYNNGVGSSKPGKKSRLLLSILLLH